MVATAAPEKPVIDRSACPADRHGDRNARWGAGCTCDDAYRDSLRYKKLQRTGRLQSRHVDNVGVARRLRALAAIGWSGPAVATELGVAHQLVAKWRSGRTRVFHDTIRRVVAVYDRLHATPAPVTPGSGRARAEAAAKQWAAPDEWIDIDDPAELPDSYYRRAGAQHLVATADLLELAGHMRVDGRPDHDAIGRRVGMSADAVQRRLERRAGGATRLTADQVYAIRDEYLRTRGDGWNGKATAKRYGVSTFVVSTIIHGTTRPELGLTDLTVQQGGHTPAAPPTSGLNRKGSAA